MNLNLSNFNLRFFKKIKRFISKELIDIYSLKSNKIQIKIKKKKNLPRIYS